MKPMPEQCLEWARTAGMSPHAWTDPDRDWITSTLELVQFAALAYAAGAAQQRETDARLCEDRAYTEECADDLRVGVVRGAPYRNLAADIRAQQEAKG